MRSWGTIVALVCAAACGRPDGRTGDVYTDGCLHWTACANLPALDFGGTLAGCMSLLDEHPASGRMLPWPGQNLTVGDAQLRCLAAAGLDCARVLDCVSTVAPLPCPSPTWACDGDTLTRCDAFAGDRVVLEDCAAEGLHCIPVGDQARCAVGPCDPATTRICMDNLSLGCGPVGDASNQTLGTLLEIVEDCAAADATCSAGFCVGNGPACHPVSNYDTRGCDGDVLILCDGSGHEERIDCTRSGQHCLALDPNAAGVGYDCALSPHLCVGPPNAGTCQGTSLGYCDEYGENVLDCKSLGYHGCSNGRCVR